MVYALEDRELYGGGNYLIQVKDKQPVAGLAITSFSACSRPYRPSAGARRDRAAATETQPARRPDFRQRAEAVLDDDDSWNTARRAERLRRVDELAVRTKISRDRLQESSRTWRQQKVLGLAAGRTMHRHGR